MQRSGHFNIFLHVFTGQINNEDEELKVLTWLIFSQETTSKMTEIWLTKGTHHTHVRVGYVGGADKHTEPRQLFMTLGLVCSAPLSAAPGTCHKC